VFPPYAIVEGIPARILRFRWKPEEILQHEAKLYPEQERLTKEELALSQSGFTN
jgi:hypothetical protein